MWPKITYTHSNITYTYDICLMFKSSIKIKNSVTKRNCWKPTKKIILKFIYLELYLHTCGGPWFSSMTLKNLRLPPMKEGRIILILLFRRPRFGLFFGEDDDIEKSFKTTSADDGGEAAADVWSSADSLRRREFIPRNFKVWQCWGEGLLLRRNRSPISLDLRHLFWGTAKLSRWRVKNKFLLGYMPHNDAFIKFS